GSARAPVPIWFVGEEAWPALRDSLETAARSYAKAAGFEPRPGRLLALPGPGGELSGVLLGIEPSTAHKDLFLAGQLPGLLPPGTYRFANAPHDPRLAALAFALGSYRFNRYREVPARDARLELPDGVDPADLTRIVEGVELARDLVNTPANDMGPAELEDAARALASRHGARFRSIVGEDLGTGGFPLIHAVGRAAARAPRLIEIGWGEPAHAKV